MSEVPLTDLVVRRFLLAEIDDAERKRIERLFIADPETNMKILIAEEDLLEDYLENSLTASDREKFLAQYGATTRQRKRLRIARTIKRYARTRAELSPKGRAVSTFGWFLSALNPRWLKIIIPVAAAVAVLVMAAWLIQLSNQRTVEANRRLAVERELAELNGPGKSGELPPQISPLILTPISLRGIERQTEIARPSETGGVVELRLLWTQKEYPSYQAVLHRVEDNQDYSISSLRLDKSLNGGAVRVRVPFSLLRNGLYQLRLQGITAAGAAEPIEEYSFVVRG